MRIIAVAVVSIEGAFTGAVITGVYAREWR
jgi:hypothetical protein